MLFLPLLTDDLNMVPNPENDTRCRSTDTEFATADSLCTHHSHGHHERYKFRGFSSVFIESFFEECYSQIMSRKLLQLSVRRKQLL